MTSLTATQQFVGDWGHSGLAAVAGLEPPPVVWDEFAVGAGPNSEASGSNLTDTITTSRANMLILLGFEPWSDFLIRKIIFTVVLPHRTEKVDEYSQADA
jgi:hypothetical protein